MKHKEFWNNVVANLKLVLPEHAINAWFEPLNAIAISEGNILLEVPNQFFCEWIDSHYKGELTTSIQKVDKAILGYRFSIGTKSSKEYEESALVQQEPKRRPTHQNNLNSQYTFKNFIEGSNNEFAKNAGFSVAENPGESNLNPLTIYGGVGLGKTHLMHAIGNQAVLKNPNLNVVVVTSERFTLDFLARNPCLFLLFLLLG